MGFPNVKAKTKDAYELYHENTFFDTGLIKELFSCSSSTACKISTIVRQEMKARGIKIYDESQRLIDRDVLYEVAGLDISKIGKSYKALYK